jgi:hypothetical protein
MASGLLRMEKPDRVQSEKLAVLKKKEPGEKLITPRAD